MFCMVKVFSIIIKCVNLILPKFFLLFYHLPAFLC